MRLRDRPRQMLGASGGMASAQLAECLAMTLQPQTRLQAEAHLQQLQLMPDFALLAGLVHAFTIVSPPFFGPPGRWEGSLRVCAP